MKPADKAPNPRVSICIVTRNRKQDLLTALGSCVAQDYPDLEVLVFDGASSDGTEDAVRSRFPSVRLIRVEQDPGFPALRNRGYQECTGSVVVSLDDDAYLTSRDTIRKLAEDLARHPQAAAIAMPFLLPPGLSQRVGAGWTSEARPHELRAFTGCAHAVRREIGLRLGPYREIPSYLKEDRDLSIRLLNAGHTIVLGSTPPVVHLYSPSRNREKRYEMDVRSALLFDYLNIPAPAVAPRMALDALQLILYQLRPSALARRMRYVARALAACRHYAGLRSPVSRAAYRLYRALPAHGAERPHGPLPRPAGQES